VAVGKLLHMFFVMLSLSFQFQIQFQFYPCSDVSVLFVTEIKRHWSECILSTAWKWV